MNASFSTSGPLTRASAIKRTPAPDRLVTIICAAVIAGISSVVLAGWVFHIPPLTRALPEFAPTHFNTAFCFLLYGAGLAATARSSVWLPRLIGTVIYLVGVTTILQSLLDHPFGIDTFSGYYLRSVA